MNKSRTLFATLAVGALVGLGAACTPPASDAPSSVVTRSVQHADMNEWVTEALPVLTDITAQSGTLALNPLDAKSAATLNTDATNGLHLTVTSGNKGIDANWKATMLDEQRVASDVRARDLKAVTRDADKSAADTQHLNNAIDAWTATQR